MKLTGLHLLLTYQCTFECDHCFVWGSPRQSGVMTLQDIGSIVQQARSAGTVTGISFEGGEPFLYYATLLAGVTMAREAGFKTGIVSNVYWATSEEDALAALRPFAGLLQAITISSDLFHYGAKLSRQARNATAAAQHLGIPISTISVARPDTAGVQAGVGEIPPGESGVMYRGRAAAKLAAYATPRSWDTFTTCPHENLAEPGRVHVDPQGNLHVCQGLVIGNMFSTALAEIVQQYRPQEHAVIGPLLQGGPSKLVRRYGLAHSETYADACHLCYEARTALRPLLAEILGPDQMYGIF